MKACWHAIGSVIIAANLVIQGLVVRFGILDPLQHLFRLRFLVENPSARKSACQNSAATDASFVVPSWYWWLCHGGN
jgi:hypothetical protein